jgi:hypothetical protein
VRLYSKDSDNAVEDSQPAFVVHVNSSVLRLYPTLADSAAVRVQSASETERGIIMTNRSGIAVPAPPPFASPAQPDHSQLHHRYQNSTCYRDSLTPKSTALAAAAEVPCVSIYSPRRSDLIRFATYYQDLAEAPASAETRIVRTPSSRHLHMWLTHSHLAKLRRLGSRHAV